jgi:hypothetical protein
MESLQRSRYRSGNETIYDGLVSTKPRIFLGDITPSEHIAQFYGDEDVFIDTLVRYVDRGFMTGDGVIVIATRKHLRALEEKLSEFTIGLTTNRLTEAYITVDADDALDKFMVNNSPDEELFLQFVLGVMERASARGRRVRAFGEMVALLLARGNVAATIRLEHLWNKVCKAHALPLFCAYWKAGITKELSTSMAEVCAVHSRIV